VASVVLAGLLLSGTAGCTFMATTATLIKYDPSDGVGTDIGDLDVRNVVAIINEDGDAISLLVTIVNSGARTANLDLQFESSGKKTTIAKQIPGNGVTSFGNTAEETQIVILSPDVTAGGLLPVYLQYGDHPGKQLLVPVLNATGPYEDLAAPQTEQED
jgi:hypothetical protein